jgi:hypothetical protein
MKLSAWHVLAKYNRYASAILFGSVFLLVGAILISCDAAGVSGGGSGGDPTPLLPFYVDDFEDGDLVNAISEWRNSNNTPSKTQIYYGTDSPPPGAGDYTLHLSMDMSTNYQVSGDHYCDFAGLNTGPTATASPLDVSEYQNFAFSLSFAGTYSGSPHYSSGGLRLYIRMSGDGGTLTYTFFEDTSFNDFVENYSTYSIPLEDFLVNSGSLAELKPALEQIEFQVWLDGDNDDAVSFELIIDEVRFEK